MPKLFGRDDVTITSKTVMSKFVWPILEGMAATDQKIVSLSVIRSTPNFQRLFGSKIKLKSLENWEKKLLPYQSGVKKSRQK